MLKTTTARSIRYVVCSAMAAAWAILVVPGMALAAKPSKGGGDDSTTPPSVTFDNWEVNNVQSDLGIPYVNDRAARTGVTFTNDGHLQLNTRTSNKLGKGGACSSTSAGLSRSSTVRTCRGPPGPTSCCWKDSFTMQIWVGAGQDDFNMLQMTEGETRTDVNLTINLLLHSPSALKTELPVFIKLCRRQALNNRHCLDSDSVSVECTGVDLHGMANEWRVETPMFDDDGDDLLNEDPIDEIDNDGDGLIDEDPPEARAAVSQTAFGSTKKI